MDKIFAALDNEVPGWMFRWADQQLLQDVNDGLLNGRDREWAERYARHRLMSQVHHIVNAALASGEVVLKGEA